MLKQEGATTFPRPVIANREGKKKEKTVSKSKNSHSYENVRVTFQKINVKTKNAFLVIQC